MQAFRPLHRTRTLWYLASALSVGACLTGPASAQPAPTSSTAAGNDAAEIQRLIKDGQHTQALKLIDEYLARTPKDPQMRFRRGVALSMLDRKAEALSVFQKLVDDHPDMPAPFNNMAVIYGAQGDYEKARSALERAIRTNPAYATAYQNLGDVYAQLASQAYTKALQLDKNDTSVQPKLSLLRELTSSPTGTSAATVAAVKPVAAPVAPAVTVAQAPAPAPVVKPTVAPPPVSSAVVVAAKPAPTPTPPPKPAVAEPKPAANATADVENAVKAWASAWSRRDMAGYVGAYASDFAGQAGSHKAWEQERRDRIANKKSISVGVSDLKVTVSGDKASARFRQTYEGGALAISSRKTLEFVRNAAGKWVIRQESVGG
jgi:ketosteroid isomerase-like protein